MRKRAWLCLLVIAAAAGCGGSSNEPGQSGSIALDEVPDKLAAAYCAVYRRCSPVLYDLLFGIEDCATLSARQFRAKDFSDIEKAVSAGTATYTASQAAACLSAIDALGCTELDNHPLTPCEQALEGSVDDGGDCDIDVECKGTSRCVIDNATCPGKCGPRASAGVACAVDGDCDAGLVCSHATGRCVAPAGVGEACGGGTAPQCQSTLLCYGEDLQMQQTGTCRDQAALFTAAEGDSCNLTDGLLCAAGLSCTLDGVSLGGAMLSCRPPVASGAACRLGVPSQCPAHEYCPVTFANVAAGMLEGTCTPLPKDGEACASTPLGSACDAYLRCSNGTCRPIGENGASCVGNDNCYSQNCVNGGCAPTSACAL